jgi:hypothetical protein
MANDIYGTSGVNVQVCTAESNPSPGSSNYDDVTGSPIESLAPCNVVLVTNNDANVSSVSVLPLADVESPHVNAFRAPYQQTEGGVHLSMPVAPAALPSRVDMNIDNYDGIDSDGEIGPFYDAVADEAELDSDDDCSWNDNEPGTEEQPQPQPQPDVQHQLPTTEQEMMLLLSNSQLREELRKRNLSTNGNKTVLVKRLLTVVGVTEVPRAAPDQSAAIIFETSDAPSSNQQPAVMTEEQLMQLSNVALKELLKEKNLSTNGSKTVMVQRILTGVPRIRAVPRNRNPQIDEEEEEGGGLTGFPNTARWKELLPQDEAVPDPVMPGLRAPTVPQDEESTPKFNFQETFDREPFIEQCQVFKEVNGKLVKDRRGNNVLETVVRTEGRANMDWLVKNKLTADSLPDKWIEPLLQDKKKPNDPKSVVTIADWCTYSNTKAILSNAGQKGGLYPEFTSFSPSEIKSFIGLYLLNGLNPSPQIKMKFKSQIEDPINGSDLCHAIFGKNAEKRHKHFKAFFSCQDPMLPTPSRKTHPNHKIDNFLSHVNRVSMEAWDMGRSVSCDEQTIGFQGRHQDKQRISYKKEGDGFQADCICENGYTYTFYFIQRLFILLFIKGKLSKQPKVNSQFCVRRFSWGKGPKLRYSGHVCATVICPLGQFI